jgi:hypothetical protein
VWYAKCTLTCKSTPCGNGCVTIIHGVVNCKSLVLVSIQPMMQDCILERQGTTEKGPMKENYPALPCQAKRAAVP